MLYACTGTGYNFTKPIGRGCVFVYPAHVTAGTSLALIIALIFGNVY